MRICTKNVLVVQLLNCYAFKELAKSLVQFIVITQKVDKVLLLPKNPSKGIILSKARIKPRLKIGTYSLH